jgi:hypothetical protein
MQETKTRLSVALPTVPISPLGGTIVIRQPQVGVSRVRLIEEHEAPIPERRKMEYQLHFKCRPLADDIWLTEKCLDPELIKT